MARERSLFQTSAFRGALVYLVVFLAVTGATLGFLYNEMARALSRSGDALIWQEAAIVSRLHATQGLDTLKDFVTARGDAGGEVVYFLADGLGARLAGNLSAFPAPDETSRTSDDWITFNVPLNSALNKTDALPVRGRVILLDNDLALLVARDIEPERAQLHAMARMFGSAMLVLVLIGLAGSVFMARRTLARVDIISDSLRDIMQGRFETRVTLTGRGDEMTLLADRLNDMTTRINTLMSAMREVTDNIAHDLRTPLNRLRGQLENTRAQISKTDIPARLPMRWMTSLRKAFMISTCFWKTSPRFCRFPDLKAARSRGAMLRSIWRWWSQILPSFTNRLFKTPARVSMS